MTTRPELKPTIARIRSTVGIYIYNSAVWICHSSLRPAIHTDCVSSVPLFLQASVFWLQRNLRHLVLTLNTNMGMNRLDNQTSCLWGQHLSTKLFFLFESTLEKWEGQSPTLMTYLLWHFVRIIPGGPLAGWLSPFCFVRETQGEFFTVHLFNSIDFSAGGVGGQTVLETITDTGNKLSFTNRTSRAAL